MSDLELIEKCIDGDLNSFSYLYEKYFDKIYRFVFLKVINKEVSEDIVSDVFVSALNKVNTFKIYDGASVGAWFYKIANNKVIDYYKSNNNNNESIDDYLDLGFNTDFGKEIDNKDKLKEIFDYIKTLNKEHRDVLIYRFWEDMSYKEISEITGLKVDNCKQIVSRTLKTITSNFVLFLIVLLII